VPDECQISSDGHDVFILSYIKGLSLIPLINNYVYIYIYFHREMDMNAGIKILVDQQCSKLYDTEHVLSHSKLKPEDCVRGGVSSFAM
jgi:hypothetical protein